jgi:Bacterial Ig-like domain (group 2).
MRQEKSNGKHLIKKIATVSKKGTVTALKKGTAIIKAKIGRKTLKCKVIVKDKRKRAAKQIQEYMQVR